MGLTDNNESKVRISADEMEAFLVPADTNPRSTVYQGRCHGVNPAGKSELWH